MSSICEQCVKMVHGFNFGFGCETCEIRQAGRDGAKLGAEAAEKIAAVMVKPIQEFLDAKEKRIQELELDNRLLRKVTLPALARSVDVLWKAVQDGVYDAREIAGDQTLNMAELLKEFGLGPLGEMKKTEGSGDAGSGRAG